MLSYPFCFMIYVSFLILLYLTEMTADAWHFIFLKYAWHRFLILSTHLCFCCFAARCGEAYRHWKTLPLSQVAFWTQQWQWEKVSDLYCVLLNYIMAKSSANSGQCNPSVMLWSYFILLKVGQTQKQNSIWAINCTFIQIVLLNAFLSVSRAPCHQVAPSSCMHLTGFATTLRSILKHRYLNKTSTTSTSKLGIMCHLAFSIHLNSLILEMEYVYIRAGQVNALLTH